MNIDALRFTLIVGVIAFFAVFFPTRMWLTFLFSGEKISFVDLLMMKVRKVDISTVCSAFILLQKQKIEIKIKELEYAYLEQYDVMNITRGLIVASQKNIPLTFEQAKAADRKGINLLNELQKQPDS
jgi:uncharacterized protein YqfA (UPF0365 family)